MIKRYITNCPEDTENLAKDIANELRAGDIILFRGGLGMGKTAFVRGLAKGLGYTGDVSSPTFTILHEYRGGRLDLCHVDAYRLTSGEDLFETGFFDYIDRGWCAAVEWGENVSDVITPALLIEFSRTGDTMRTITVTRR